MHRDVIYKLLGFTAAMAFLPIAMYFLTVKTIFGGMTIFLASILKGKVQ
jgi:hypothetical protein